jgi:hypothetical protein
MRGATRGREIGPERRDESHAKLAGEGILAGAAQRLDVLGIAEHAARALDHGLTRNRQRDLARPPLHERDAQRILELAHLGRERRLAHVAAFGRPPEMPGFGERDEVFEVTESHRVDLLYTSEQSIGYMDSRRAPCRSTQERRPDP